MIFVQNVQSSAALKRIVNGAFFPFDFFTLSPGPLPRCALTGAGLGCILEESK